MGHSISLKRGTSPLGFRTRGSSPRGAADTDASLWPHPPTQCARPPSDAGAWARVWRPLRRSSQQVPPRVGAFRRRGHTETVCSVKEEGPVVSGSGGSARTGRCRHLGHRYTGDAT